MISGNERQKVFWLLKKYSSYTAWKALGDVYCKFSIAFEYAIQNRKSYTKQWLNEHIDEKLCQDDIREINESDRNQDINWLKRILDGQIAFEKGLPLLKQGKRSVFRNFSNGYLGKAADAIIFVNRIMDPTEFTFDWMPNKTEILQLAKLLQQAANGLFLVCEAEENGPMPGVDVFLSATFAPFNFPLILPKIPDISTLQVKTNHAVPVDGIWQPEWQGGITMPFAGADRGGPSSQFHASHERLQKGCVNYLLSGTVAQQYQEHKLDKPISVIWRLVWEDKRYLDGSIPPEETEYMGPLRAPDDDATAASNVPSLAGGNPCSRDGYWETPAKFDSRRYFSRGEIMPVFENSQYGATIWQWSTQQ